MGKRCKACLKELPYSEFTTHTNTADKLQPLCRPCISLRNKVYRLKNGDKLRAERLWFYRLNREKIKKESREWAAARRDAVRARCRAYHHRNREKRLADMAAWQRLNAEALRPYYAEKTRRRFAAMRRGTPKWADADKILAIYVACKDVSERTGIKHHVDHVVPIISDLVCGLHVEHNLQILTATDNLAKSNHFQVIES